MPKEYGKYTSALIAGQKHDAPQGRKLIESIYSDDNHYLVMDRAYEDDRTWTLAVHQGFIPVVPPKEIYRRRNEIERYFLQIRRFIKVFARYDKINVIYYSVISIAMIFDDILM